MARPKAKSKKGNETAEAKNTVKGKFINDSIVNNIKDLNVDCELASTYEWFKNWQSDAPFLDLQIILKTTFLIAGKIEKPTQPKSKDKSALKKAAKETPAKLQNEKKPKPISKKKKELIKKARESLASGELASEDKDRRIERDSRTLYLR